MIIYLFTKNPLVNVVKKDLNQDALVNILDINHLVNLILIGNSNSFEKCVGDCYEDGILNVIDLVEIVNFILEIN